MVLKWWWRSSREVWCVALSPRLMWGRINSLYVRTWNFGPLTVAHTHLDRP